MVTPNVPLFLSSCYMYALLMFIICKNLCLLSQVKVNKCLFLNISLSGLLNRAKNYPHRAGWGQYQAEISTVWDKK